MSQSRSEPFTFASAGDRLVGVLWLPTQQPVAAVVTTGSLDAQEAADRIGVPFLLVHSEHALAPPLARNFYAVVKTQKSELWLESQGQIDFYDQPRLIDPATDAIAEHLTTAFT
jgi:hypothetical protein